jgi:hypothetical protein
VGKSVRDFREMHDMNVAVICGERGLLGVTVIREGVEGRGVRGGCRGFLVGVGE